MLKAFLLRFQEPCEVEVAIDQSTAIGTATKVDREGSKDQAYDEAYALPASQIATTTRQEREATDRINDFSGEPGIAIPMAARATKTVTEVKAESTDDDANSMLSPRAVPGLLMARNHSTKTVTAVKAEADDQDDDRRRTFPDIHP